MGITLKMGVRFLACGFLLTAILGAKGAFATENEGTDLTLGATTFKTPVFDDTGLYYSAYFNQYDSGRFNQRYANSPNTLAIGLTPGNHSVSGFDLKESVLYNDVTYITPWKIGGIQIATGLVVPIASVAEWSTTVFGTGIHQSVTNIGDLLVQPLILGWSRDKLHIALAQGFFAPTGEYNPAELISIGRNVWEYQPQFSIGYIDPNGIEATATLSYGISSPNNNPMYGNGNPFNGEFEGTTPSKYQSGQEFEADFATGYNITPNFEVGLTGYVYQQTTADSLSDPTANAAFQALLKGNYGSVFAFGPGLRYLTKFGEFYAEIQQEVYAQNRTQGDSYWLRWSI